MVDIRQSPLYAEFMRSIGWQVENIDGIYIYIKKLPLIGSLIKIQRPNKLPHIEKLKLVAKKCRARSIIIEPNLNSKFNPSTLLRTRIHNSKFLNDPFLPTKTVLVDLSKSAPDIFANFTEAKRRAVRRAQKKGVLVKTVSDINMLIKLKNYLSGFLGFLTTQTIKPLWQVFYPQSADLLQAYFPDKGNSINPEKTLGMLLLLNWNKICYYWMAGATPEGKKNFAPTLLVWEAFKLAKKRGCQVFDFEGIYDERFPQLNRNWLGFTKFKTGFGGREIYFPKPFKLI